MIVGDGVGDDDFVFIGEGVLDSAGKLVQVGGNPAGLDGVGWDISFSGCGFNWEQPVMSNTMRVMKNSFCIIFYRIKE